jgi:hypothetical protein
MRERIANRKVSMRGTCPPPRVGDDGSIVWIGMQSTDQITRDRASMQRRSEERSTSLAIRHRVLSIADSEAEREADPRLVHPIRIASVQR